jgi:rSAM/selenodomain-associated transferase 2
MTPPRVSIVIPVRNDAEALARTLDWVGGLQGMDRAEIVVAAAPGPDATERVAAGRARVLRPGGSTRAELMNAGAAAACGDTLFFLHADSFPPPDALALIGRALADPRVVGGAFEHLFDEEAWSLRAITWIDRIRYRLTRNWYGDQGIFVRAAVFRELGGYRELRILEDLDFSRRLKRRGRSALVRVPLRTSGRRFLARGPWRTLGFCVWLLALDMLGLDTERYAERWRGPADRAPGSPWTRAGFGGVGVLRRLLRRYAAREAADVAPFLAGRRVLDLGSGEGWVAAALARDGVFVCGADVGAFALAPVPYVVYDGRQLPFADAAFDTTLLLLTLHHCEKPEAVLDEALRVTRARLIVTESVHRDWLDRFWLDLLDGRVNRLRHGGRMPAPGAFRSRDEWRGLFASRGCRIVATAWLGGRLERLVHHPVLYVLDVRGADG